MMDISFSDEFGYTSALSGVSSCSQDMCFYSVPTSPRRLKLCVPSGSQTGTTTPTTYEDANSNLDEFEFETSRRFNNLSDLDNEKSQWNENTFDHQQQEQRPCGDSLPSMAFADELFSDGKVLPLEPRLKLPPRLLLQNGDGNTQSPTTTSPRSPGSMLRLPFSRHSLWKDEFDPFMVALEKVKEEKRGKPKTKHGLRRTRSLSPFRFNYKSVKHEGLSQEPDSHCCDTAQLICEHQKEPIKQGSGGVSMLSEPKGLVFARQVRLVRLGNGTFEPKWTSDSKFEMETKKDESEGSGFWARKKKRENIMKLLFGNGHMGKGRSQHKLEYQKGEMEKPAFMRKHDMNSLISTQSARSDKDETTCKITKMRLVCNNKPRLFLCLGFDEGSVK